jgi:hypothetical protein
LIDENHAMWVIESTCKDFFGTLKMSTDGGCIEPGEKVVAVTGTGAGADTAVVASAAPSGKLSMLRVHEIIYKPL